jgi:carboxymethylenebutenolidase
LLAVFNGFKMLRFFGLVLATVLLIWTMGQGRSLSLQPPVGHSYAEQMAVLHNGDRPIATPLVAQIADVPLSKERVTYGQIGDRPLKGYLAYPKVSDRPLPAIIVIHEWWGLNDNIEAMTRKLAAEGYTALAVDLYEGKVAQTPEQAKTIMMDALQQTPRLEENLNQAYQYLKNSRNAPKIASMGWCFGGTWSLNTALLLPDKLDAAVIYYGGNLETDPDRLKTLTMPILGIFGALDRNPTPETVETFEQTLKQLGKTAEIYIYPNADHAFANPSGTRYNPEAAEDAWQKTSTFLKKTLKNS